MTRLKVINPFILCFTLLASTLFVPATWAQNPTGKPGLVERRAKLFERTQRLLSRGQKSAALKTMKQYIALGTQPNLNDLYNGFLVARGAASCSDMYLFSLGHDALAGAEKRPKEITTSLKRCRKKLGESYPIQITSNIDEANVRINGIWLGMLPLKPVLLHAGEYKIRVTHPNHNSYESKHRISKRAAPDFRAFLTKRKTFGTLVIRTSPEGAFITLEGKDMGKAPLGPIQLETGKHFVELTMDGYDKFIRNVKIRRGEETLFEATLESKKGGQ